MESSWCRTCILLKNQFVLRGRSSAWNLPYSQAVESSFASFNSSPARVLILSFSDFDTKKRIPSRNKVMTQTLFVGGSSLSIYGFKKLSDQNSVVPDGADLQELYVTR